MRMLKITDFTWYILTILKDGGLNMNHGTTVTRRCRFRCLLHFEKKNIMHFLEKEYFAGREHFTTAFIKTYITDNILDINPDLL